MAYNQPAIIRTTRKCFQLHYFYKNHTYYVLMRAMLKIMTIKMMIILLIAFLEV